MRTPEEIVAELAPAYGEWKGGEKVKNKLKTEFFDSITEHLKASDSAAEDLVTVEANDAQEARETIEKLRPTWIVEDLREAPDREGFWEVILVEDPAFMPFTIEFDGQVWGRQIAEGSMMLDDDLLQVEKPDLWKRISEYPNQKLMEDIAYEAGMDPSDPDTEESGGLEGYVERQCERHGLKRFLKSMDDIDDEDLAEMQDYTYPGPPTVKLPAPKKVKE